MSALKFVGVPCFHLPKAVASKIFDQKLEKGEKVELFLKVSGGLEAFVDGKHVLLKGVPPDIGSDETKSAQIWLSGRELKWNGAELQICPKVGKSLSSFSPRPLMGRELFLQTLRKRLERDSRVILTGMRGVGKSALAGAYQNKFASSYTHRWEIQASQFNMSFLALAHSVGLEGAEAMKTWLQETKGWLIVVEDVLDITFLDHYFPSTLGGHLLVVSPRRSWKGELELPPLEMEEAIECFHVSTGFENQDGVRKLVMKLGFLPSAIEQTGDHLKGSSTSYLQFLASLELSSKPLQKFEIWTRWKEAVNALQKESPAAYELLEQLACLNGNGIPKYLFTQNDHLDDLLYQLNCRYMLQTCEGIIAVDPLAQQIVNEHAKGNALVRLHHSKFALPLCYYLGAIALRENRLSDAMDAFTFVIEAQKTKTEQPPHLLALSKMGCAKVWAENNEQLKADQMLEEALTLVKHLSPLEEAYGWVSSEIYTDAAFFFLSQKKYEEAKQACLQALSCFHHAIEKEGPHLARTFHFLGLASLELKEHNQALFYLENACKLYPPTDLFTKALYQLAHLYFQFQETQKASDTLVRLLDLYDTEKKKEDSFKAHVLFSLAKISTINGNFQMSTEYLFDAHCIHKRLIPENKVEQIRILLALEENHKAMGSEVDAKNAATESLRLVNALTESEKHEAQDILSKMTPKPQGFSITFSSFLRNTLFN